jgi:hypothetical protein
MTTNPFHSFEYLYSAFEQDLLYSDDDSYPHSEDEQEEEEELFDDSYIPEPGK